MRATHALPILAFAAILGPAARAQPPAEASASTPAVTSATDCPGGIPPAASRAGGRIRIVPRAETAIDATVHRAQAAPTDLPAMPLPGANLPAGTTEPALGGNSISLQAALLGAITGNPDLVTLRNSSIASPEAVEAARRFPTTLNPTIWVDFRPINLIPPDTFASIGTAAHRTGPFYHLGKVYYNISYRQPIELGHQTTHRHAIARAALSQQQWNVVQAELLALVQTYRFFQTAAYRREKLRVARDLATSNDRLVQALGRGLEAGQVNAADVALAEVENQAIRQQVEVAQQDYANALTDLRNQIGMPEAAGTAEPLGEFILPRNIPEVEDRALIELALQCRPDLFAARSAVAGAEAALRLAQGDRRPTPVIGPEYQSDEVSVQYIGLIFVMPLPILNNGRPLVAQRRADAARAVGALRAAEQRVVTQVRAATAKWNAANRLVGRTAGLTEGLKSQVERLERLFDQDQATLAQLLQARQRLIQLENAELDALWQATQAQADLLIAVGAPNLIAALQEVPPPAAPPASAATAPPATPPTGTAAATPAAIPRPR